MSATLTVIWWRDIPAQVVAKDGRRASKVVLHPRFQVAIDKAAVKAGRRAMDDYIVLVGGAPLNEEFGIAVGADAYCRDAGVAAETARRLIDARRASVA